MKHAQRGQAVVETVIFLPMFLIALFGIIWTVQAAVQSERVESAVRYAGLISQQANPYVDYSLYSMYTQLGSTLIPTVTCISPITAPLSDAAPTYASTHISTVASAPFWTPASAQPSCASAGLVGIQAGTGLVQDVILSQQQPGMTATTQVTGPLTQTLGAFTSTEADAHFFKPVGVNVILGCYATLSKQIMSSLEYQTDPATAVAPTALGTTVTAISLSPSSSCTTF